METSHICFERISKNLKVSAYVIIEVQSNNQLVQSYKIYIISNVGVISLKLFN